MTQKELLETVLSELKNIKKEIPFSENSILLERIDELKENVTFIKSVLLNPETGVIVKVNKNTHFREEKEHEEAHYLEYKNDLADLKKWRDSINKALWIMFTTVVGILIKIVFFP